MLANLLLSQRAIVFVGTVLLFVAGGILMLYSPVPGNLSTAHAQIRGLTQLDGCDNCHGPEGITPSCLECHQEIRAQLDDQTGFHYALQQQKPEEKFECAECHQEHNGADFRLVNQIAWGAQTKEAFRHPHVEFNLGDSHDTLQCEQCHDNEKPFYLPKFRRFEREHTFLGVTQDCVSCHTDIHTYGLTPGCDTCHGQESFRTPEFFDHGHFPLVGGHDTVPCVGCHILPEDVAVLVDEVMEDAGDTNPAVTQVVQEVNDLLAESESNDNPDEETDARSLSDAERPPFPFPFDKVRGTSCVDCHDSPHRADFSSNCGECHQEDGFNWLHARDAMTPALHETTGFTLLGAHRETSCDGCHPSSEKYEVRHPDPTDPSYNRTEDNCTGCHSDVHEGQFEERYKTCLDCHSRHQFIPTQFGHAAHSEVFPLLGSHGAVPCTECHTKSTEDEPRRFVGTEKNCRSCHEDPHGTQFRDKIQAKDCTNCHSDQSDSFEIVEFNHTEESGYELKGGHSKAECNDCHTEQETEIGGNKTLVRRYEETPTDCASCHRDVHRGQFQDRDSCQDCHNSFNSFQQNKFDHDTMSRFPLEGHHAVVPCSGCHVPVTLDDGTEVVQYKPLGTECRDCHELDTGPPKAR